MSAMGETPGRSLAARVAALERLIHLAVPAAVAFVMLLVPVGRHDTSASGDREPAWQMRSLLALTVDYEPDGRAQTIAYGLLIVSAVCLAASAVIALVSWTRQAEMRTLLLTLTGIGVPAGLAAWYLLGLFLPARDETVEALAVFGLIPGVLAWLFASADGRLAFQRQEPGS